ncbi:helix-turn-helix domain-containing protein [Caminicella sporogenes]|uniref:helix-turn-helix domain-containing protein n=1 Tax=Caminicella sporogenes TaxID=166485 RepID=UPI0025411F0C|nr:helix-turn-helix transcriptional regulator [Caminicella sporogenes]WIF95020.1 helix-turn-helix transcriptional regulator [Caminicella sporogenes]
MIEIDVEKIALERAIQGLTVRELSKKSGVGASTISKLELRKSKPRLTTVAKIAKGLGKNVEDFIKKE